MNVSTDKEVDYIVADYEGTERTIKGVYSITEAGSYTVLSGFNRTALVVKTSSVEAIYPAK